MESAGNISFVEFAKVVQTAVCKAESVVYRMICIIR